MPKFMICNKWKYLIYSPKPRCECVSLSADPTIFQFDQTFSLLEGNLFWRHGALWASRIAYFWVRGINIGVAILWCALSVVPTDETSMRKKEASNPPMRDSKPACSGRTTGTARLWQENDDSWIRNILAATCRLLVVLRTFGSYDAHTLAEIDKRNWILVSTSGSCMSNLFYYTFPQVHPPFNN